MISNIKKKYRKREREREREEACVCLYMPNKNKILKNPSSFFFKIIKTISVKFKNRF